MACPSFSWATTKRRLREVQLVCAKHPLCWILPSLLTAALLAVGIWAVVFRTQLYENEQKSRALSQADATGDALFAEFNVLLTPLWGMGLLVRVSLLWSNTLLTFTKVAEDIWNENKATYISRLELAPNGIISAVYPPTNATPFDLLGNPVSRQQSYRIIESGNISLLGPTPLMSNDPSRESDLGLVARMPIYLHNAVDPTGKWIGLPQSPNLWPNCSVCYDNRTKIMWWGFATVTTYISDFLDNVSALSTLQYYGYNYRLTRGATVLGEEEVVIMQSKEPPSDPVRSVIYLPSTEWYLYVAPADGWGGDRVLPLLAPVVIAALLLGALLFFLSISRVQHKALLKAVAPQEVIDRLRTAEDYLVSTAIVASGTPIEKMLSILGDFLEGRQPGLSDVLLVRTALMHNMDPFKPIGLEDKILRHATVDADVARALMRELGTATQDPDWIDHHVQQQQQLTYQSSINNSDRALAALAKSSSVGLGSNLLRKSTEFCNIAEALSALMAGEDMDGGGQPTASDAASCTSETGGKPYASPPASHSLESRQSVPDSPNIKISLSASPSGNQTSGPPVPSGKVSGLKNLLNNLSRKQDEGPRSPDNLNLSAHGSPPSSTLPAAPALISGLPKAEAVAVVLVPSPPMVEEVEKFLGSMYMSWEFDAFKLSDISCGHPLSTLGYYIFHTTGLIAKFNLKPVRLARYLRMAEAAYKDNPYHNKIHAADVLQTMSVILLRGGLVPHYADPLTHLACLLAAAIHDLEHVGYTNDFLIYSENPLAQLYNDRSPMENHHLAAAFALLRRPELNFISHFPRGDKEKLRKTMIELVLATDMKQHFSIHSQFSTVHRLATTATPIEVAAPQPQPPSQANGGRAQSLSRVLSSRGGTVRDAHPRSSMPETDRSMHGRHSGQAVLARDSVTRSAGSGPISAQSGSGSRENGVIMPLVHTPIDENERLLTLQVALKIADIGLIAEGLDVHIRWVYALESEFFNQGDLEKRNGMAVSPLFDRDKPGVSKSQPGFFDVIAWPMFHNFAHVFPNAKPMLELIATNYRYWKQRFPPAAPPSSTNGSPPTHSQLKLSKPSMAPADDAPAGRGSEDVA